MSEDMGTALMPAVDISGVDWAAFEAAVADLGPVVAQLGLTDLVTLGARHQHFKLAKGEVLVDVPDAQKRTVKTCVVSRTDVTPEQASQWEVGYDGVASPTNWSQGQIDVEGLAAARSVLAPIIAERGYSNLVTIGVRQRDFPLGDDEVLMENNDPEHRFHLVTVVRREDVVDMRAAHYAFDSLGQPMKLGICKPPDNNNH